MTNINKHFNIQQNIVIIIQSTAWRNIARLKINQNDTDDCKRLYCRNKIFQFDNI